MIARAVNQTAETHDATAHAEVVAMRQAGQALGGADLRDATLYSSLQPCGMCSMALILSNIGRIVYGADRSQVHAMYFEDRSLSTMDFIADAYKYDLVLSGPCLGDECAELYFRPGDDVPDEQKGNA